VETKILDRHGNAQSEDWLRQMFGPVEIHRFEGEHGYRVAELREEEGAPETTITVRADGAGGEKGQTDGQGQVRFKLEKDARYSPPEKGPYLTLIRRDEAPGDAVLGLGLVRQANKRHLNIVFRWGEAPGPSPEPTDDEEPEPVTDDEEPEPVTDDMWAQVLARLDRIEALLEQITPG
jgi:hypothetical protein